MELNYCAASCFFSFALTAMLSSGVCRSRRQRLLFSAARGIIIYRIVKSIIVECGWGFASAVGIASGLFAEAAVMGLGITLFHELDRILRPKNRESILSAIGVITVFSGKWLLYECSLIPDAAAFIVGNAISLTLLTCAVFLDGKEEGMRRAGSLAGFSAVCAAGSFAAGIILPPWAGDSLSAAAPALIMLGVCELVIGLTESLKKRNEISPAGFALGLMLTCCVDSLTG